MKKLAMSIWNSLDTKELELRELENGCDFDGTQEHYINTIVEMIKSKSEDYEEEGYYLSEEDEEAIKQEVQEMIDNDFSCLGE